MILELTTLTYSTLLVGSIAFQGRSPSAVAEVLTQWLEAHCRQSSVARTVVERTYHHFPARYTGHRAGSPLA